MVDDFGRRGLIASFSLDILSTIVILIDTNIIILFFKKNMRETAIIYCRKSTDREDRQTNSLEHQLKNCRKSAENNALVVLDEIQESVSAKTWWKRAWFNRMIQECSKWRVDYIIIDETKRLARNIMDSALIIWLLDNNQIKWIITTDKKFEASDISAKFMLLLELWISKMDNEHRSKDIKAKMITALHRWQWLSKATFGYENVWPKWKRDVKVVEEEAKLVLNAFIMRSQNRTLQEISDFLEEKTSRKWNWERVSKMLTNTKYYWLQKFWWEEALLNSPWYRPIVSKELFDKVNKVTRTIPYNKHESLPRYFSNLLKDDEWNNLYVYKTKWHIYYHSGQNTSYKINISQKQIFSEVEKYIDNYNFPKPFIALSKATLKEYYKDKVSMRETDMRRTKKELTQVEERLSSLLEKFLDNDIDKKTYDEKKKTLSTEKIQLEESYNAIKQWDNNIIEIIENLCELVENLSGSYKNGNDAKKWKIIRAMQCELILNNKKELVIKENKLFEIIKSLNFQHWYSIITIKFFLSFPV